MVTERPRRLKNRDFILCYIEGLLTSIVDRPLGIHHQAAPRQELDTDASTPHMDGKSAGIHDPIGEGLNLTNRFSLVMKKILPILVLLVFLALSHEACAHATTLMVKVVNVSLVDDEYIIRIEPQGDVNLPKQASIHLRFNPKKAAFAASNSKEDFDAALQVLKAAAVGKNPITIGAMSNKGFNAIKGRPGHYRSEMIQLVDWFKGPAVVCFFHSDRYAEAPK